MFYALSISLFGSVFGIRIFDRFVARQFFDDAEMTKIGTAYFISVLVLAFSLPRSHLSLWIAVFSPILVIAIALFALVRRRSRHLRCRLTEVLGVISLKMKTGRSFRQSLSEVINESEPRLRAKLSEIASVVVFSQQSATLSGDPFVSVYVNELILIDRQPHAAAKRLAVYREKIRIEDDFRRRSGQVLARIHAQSLVMAGLYIALAVFIAWKFGFSANRRMFMLSAALFALGSFWMLKGGRKLRWMV